MRSSKNTIALVSLVAACSSMFTIPANAASVRIEGETCRFAYNPKELEYFKNSGVTPLTTTSWKNAQAYAVSFENDLAKDKEGLKLLKAQYNDGLFLDVPEGTKPDKITAEDKAKAKKKYLADVESIQQSMKAKEALIPAAKACAAGESLSDPSVETSALSNEFNELNDAGIGVIVAAVLLLLGGAVAAVLPQLGLV